jgi:predicted RNase H-like nuclease
MSDILYKNFLIDKYLLYKTKTKKDIEIKDLIECFVLSLQETAIVFGKCTTTIKRILRKHNIKRWPCRFIRGYCKKKYSNTSYVNILKNEEFLLMCKEKFINNTDESFDLSFDLNNQSIDKSTCNSVVNMKETIQINKIKQNINKQKGVLYNLILKEKQLLDKIVEEKTAKVKQLEDILNDM